MLTPHLLRPGKWNLNTFSQEDRLLPCSNVRINIRNRSYLKHTIQQNARQAWLRR